MVSGCCWWGVGNVERERRRKRERERERERERRHGEDGGWGERERASQPASQPARQKEKAALRTKDQFSEMTPNWKAFLLAKRILKPITATRVK